MTEHRLKKYLPWGIAAGAGTLGFIVNGFPFPVSDDLELIFGGIAVFLVVLTIGPGPGTLAAALTGLRTWFLWGHPYALPFLILEAWVVGYLKQRREMSPAIGVALYWLVAGPAMYALFVSRKFFPDDLELAITLKFVTNSLLCVIIADALLAFRRVSSNLSRLTNRPPANTSIRTNLVRAFLFITVLPTCVLAIWSGQSNIARQKQASINEMRSVGTSLARAVGDHLNEHQRAIESLADLINQSPTASNDQIRKWLTRTRERYPGFVTMLITDAAGMVSAGSPDIPGEKPLSVADREYYRVPMANRRSFVSDAFTGRGFGTESIVAISAPLFAPDGSVSGIVEGSLPLARFQQFADDLHADPNKVIIVISDPRNQIAYSNQPKLFPALMAGSETCLKQFSESSRPNNEFQLIRNNVGVKNLPDRQYLGIWSKDDRTGWNIFILVSSRTTQAVLNTFYLQMFLWMLGFIPLASFLSQFVANSVIAPLKRLTEATDGLSQAPDAPVGPIFDRLTRQLDAPSEINQLIRVFTNLAQRLENTFHRLQQTNIDREIANQRLQMAKEDLDRQVRERTAQLAQTIEQLKVSKADSERHQEHLRQSQKMEALGQLAGGIAHNFNNLLAVIMGYSSLELTRLSPESPSFRSAKAIRRATERGRDLVRHLMSFSRSNEATMETVNLHETIQNTVTMVEKLIGEDITLSVTLSDLKPTVFANVQEIEQVFLNLMLNARDAMPAGGTISIQTGEPVHAEEIAAPGVIFPSDVSFPDILRGERFYRVSVSDSGTGMPPEVLQRLFEPFFTTKEQGRGTGLGLATVFGTVTKAGGFLRVESHPGKGSTFHVYLPCRDVAVTKPTSGDNRASRQFAAIKLDQSPTVLVVEDEAEVLEVACEILKAHGFTTVSAQNGAEALAYFETPGAMVDLVLSDVRMPRMNGPRMASELRKTHPETPVLFMSGYNELADTGQIHFFDNNLIRKPFEGSQLIRKIQEMLKTNGE